jgi:hypothetical protein
MNVFALMNHLHYRYLLHFTCHAEFGILFFHLSFDSLKEYLDFLKSLLF